MNPYLTGQAKSVFNFEAAPTAVAGTAASTHEVVTADTILPSVNGLSGYTGNGRRIQVQQSGDNQYAQYTWTGLALDASPPAGGSPGLFNFAYSLVNSDRRTTPPGVQEQGQNFSVRLRWYISNTTSFATDYIQLSTSATASVKSVHDVMSIPLSDWQVFGAGFDANLPINNIRLRVYGGVVGDQSADPDVVMEELSVSHVGVPIISIGFDDGHISNMGAADDLELRGLRGYFSITASSVGGTDRLSVNQVRELRARGHEIVAHPNVPGDTDAAGALALLDANLLLFASWGIDIKHVVFHQGRYGNDYLDGLEARGFMVNRTTFNLSPIDTNSLAYANRTPATIRSSSFGIGAPFATAAQAVPFLDNLEAKVGHWVTNGHIIVPSGAINNGLEANQADWEGFLDEVAARKANGQLVDMGFNEAAVAQGLATAAAELQVTVPAVESLTTAAVTAAFAAEFLTVGNTTQSSHPTVPLGLVISANPASGQVIDANTAVDLVVSTGPDTGGGTLNLSQADIDAIVQGLLGALIENGETLRDQLRLIRAAAAGTISQNSAGDYQIRSADGSKNRIAGAPGGNGGRNVNTVDSS